jgi:hypothetical protein
MKRDPWWARAAVWLYLHTVWRLGKLIFRKDVPPC